MGERFLDELRCLAIKTARADDLTRRPTWAPPLILEGELLDLLHELEWLTPEEKPLARLWAEFTDPRRGEVQCQGFELRAGHVRAGKKIFETQHFDKAAVLARLDRWIEQTQSPDVRRRLEGNRRQTEAIQDGWSYGPKWIRARTRERLDKLNHAVELGWRRVMDFAGCPVEQMRRGGRFWGHCCICGKGLTDHKSRELGIGPECRQKLGVTIQALPGEWIIGGRRKKTRVK